MGRGNPYAVAVSVAEGRGFATSPSGGKGQAGQPVGAPADRREQEPGAGKPLFFVNYPVPAGWHQG